MCVFRDQSCTDILDLYNKMKSEFSSEEDEEVSLRACVSELCLEVCVCVSSTISMVKNNSEKNIYTKETKTIFKKQNVKFN